MMGAEGFEYIAKFKIPGMGTYSISKGAFMPGDDLNSLRCWHRGSAIGIDSSEFSEAKQLLQARIKDDIRYRLDELLDELTELNEVFKIAKQSLTSEWLTAFTVEPTNDS